VILELRAQGTTVILSTHDMAVAERMCDPICMIFRGRKVLDGTLAAIQDRFGTDTVRVRTAAGPGALHGLADVEAVVDFGQYQEVRMHRNADSQRLLRVLADRTAVLRFEIARPSLHDIFVRIAAPQNQEVPDA
jgi:ABC-2 type transport system ATP-binding protein